MLVACLVISGNAEVRDRCCVVGSLCFGVGSLCCNAEVRDEGKQGI